MLSITIETSLRLHPLFLTVPAPTLSCSPGSNHPFKGHRDNICRRLYQKGYSTKPPQFLFMSFEKYSHAGEAQLRKPLHPFLEILKAVSSAEPAAHKRLTWDWESGHLILQAPISQENLGYSLIDYGQFTTNLKQWGITDSDWILAKSDPRTCGRSPCPLTKPDNRQFVTYLTNCQI